MYSANANYPFGNAAQPFTNAAPQQPGMQPAQQIMYNQQQQFAAGMAPQGGFPAGNPQMMPGAHAGMMQSPGMPAMGANGQMPNFQQQQFAGAQYGQVLPSSVGQQNFAPNNYMIPGGMAGFPMNQAGGMPPQQQQQMMQRMQQQQQQHQQQQHHQHQQQQQQMNPAMSQSSTPQRPPSAPQGTPAQQIASQHGQFPTPQPPSQSQTPSNQQQQQQPQPQQQPQQQPQSMGQTTPQTPTFGQNQSGNNGPVPQAVPPLSPGAVSREKDRFALLLDINHELLYESIQIQTTQQELKKEHATEGNPGEKKSTPEESLWTQDYLQCMKRLQANLTYMAAVADRKPEVKVPPCPAFLSPPPLNLTLRLRAQPIGIEGPDQALFDPLVDREHRDKSIKELYQRLQAAFPNIDPKKEPTYRASGAAQRPGNQGMSQASPTAPQMPNMNAPHPSQGGMMS